MEAEEEVVAVVYLDQSHHRPVYLEEDKEVSPFLLALAAAAVQDLGGRSLLLTRVL